LPTPPLSREAVELGDLLRRARGDRPLREIRDRCGKAPDGTPRVSVATLSYVENGKRLVSPGLLDAIVSAVGADSAEAFRLAGLLPPQAVAEVLGPEVAHVLAGGGLTNDARAALRRVHLAELAAGLTGNLDQPPVAIDNLLFNELGIDNIANEAVGWARFKSFDTIEYNQRFDGDAARGERNLIFGHMTAHALVAREAGRPPHCSHEAGGRLEGEATWLGGLILMPRPLLESEFHGRAPQYLIATEQGLSDLVRDLAGAA
jgi:transcriptional regulator with XRE-family HTH domain